MAKPFGVSVCVYRIRPVFKDLFLFLKSHIWHGLKLVTELGLRKGFAVACHVRESGCAAR